MLNSQSIQILPYDLNKTIDWYDLHIALQIIMCACMLPIKITFI